MDRKEADRLWNLPKCERCEAMEVRLKACLIANESLNDGLRKAEQALREVYAMVKLLQQQKNWGKA